MAHTMTNAPVKKDEKARNEVLCAVLPDEDIAVVRVVGRGNFANSMPLKSFTDHLHKEGRPQEFILDLSQCETLDSTFMGTVACISLNQSRGGRRKAIVLNASEHVRRLLKTLGLTALVEMRDSSPVDTQHIQKADGTWSHADGQDLSRLEQIVHTLEAHKTLVKIDEENEVRFQSVIHYLEQSLKNAEAGHED